MDDVSLTTGVKTALLSIQQTDRKIRRTTERLATGKRVNSPLDDPTNYFVANALRDSAADIEQLHHAISNGVSVIKATSKALESVNSLLQTMKALVDGAATTSDPAHREALAASFDETYAQLNGIVRDSGYAGTNLISNSSTDPLAVASQNLNIPLNPQGSSEFQVSGNFMGSGYVLHETPGGQPAWVADDRGGIITGYGTTGGSGIGNLSSVELIIRMNPQVDTSGDVNGDGLLQAGEGTEIDFRLTNTSSATATGISFSNATISTGWSFAFNTSASFGNVPPGSSVITNTGSDLDLELPAGANGTPFSITLAVTSDGVTRSLTFGPLTVGTISNGQILPASGAATVPAKPAVSTRSLTVNPADYQNGIFGVTFPGPPPEYKTLYAEKQGLEIYHSWVYEGFRTGAGIEAARSDLNRAIEMVRSYSTEIGNGNIIVSVRNEFNDALSDIYVTGADNLTLADMNEESANMLMLQTRQKVGTTAVSMASQASQSVLKMLE